jgi:hypothetical protein
VNNSPKKPLAKAGHGELSLLASFLIKPCTFGFIPGALRRINTLIRNFGGPNQSNKPAQLRNHLSALKPVGQLAPVPPRLQ